MLIPSKDLKDIFGVEPLASATLDAKTKQWLRAYKGQNYDPRSYVKSLRLEKSICREFSEISVNEMEYDITNEKLKEIFEKAVDPLKEKLQRGLAVGGFIIKPLGEDNVQFVMQGDFIPIEIDDKGRLKSVIFPEVRQKDDRYYTRLEYHYLSNKGLTIENVAFVSPTKGKIGTQCELSVIDDWASLPEIITYQGMDKVDFGYFKVPIDNDVDDSEFGISIFDSAMDLITDADIQKARLDWEFKSGERALHISPRAYKKVKEEDNINEAHNKNTREDVAVLNARMYKSLNLDVAQDGDLYKEFSPELRQKDITDGLEEYLRRIEFTVGLSYGDLSDPKYVEKTATEIKISKQRKYNTVTGIQKQLRYCLEDLIDALAFYNAMFTTGYEVTINFEDSILTDEETERKQDMEDVASGMMSAWEYRMKWYGETEEEAKANTPQTATVMM